MIDTTTTTTRLDFVLDPAHEAHQPPETGGGRRDDVRLLVSIGDAAPVHAAIHRTSVRSSPRATSWS